jgi:molecular chaperone DnaK (HSP70)
MWSDLAKDRTLKAFSSAVAASTNDLTSTHPTISLVSEPEAAAIYALHGLDPHGLQIGDSFVLCDAGGGTVDLISYTIEALYPTLQIREAATGTGGLCGSTFLNKRFGEYLEAKLKNESGWDAEVLAEAMERFDSVVCTESTRPLY